jgi:hypothetical protein
LITHLRKKVYYHSAAPTIHLRRSLTCVDHSSASITHLRRSEKVILIQFSRKNRPLSIQSKKPFSFNSGKKAVPIQFSRKSRPQVKSRSHLTQVKKSSSFNLGKKPFSFSPGEKAVLIQLR